MTDYGFEHLKWTENDVLRMKRDIRDVLEAPLLPEHLIARKQLNVEHRLAYKAIIKHVKQNLPGAFFIDGPRGTGKTYLYHAIYGKARSLGKIVLPTASSGIAAAGLRHGRTAHSRFKLPLDHSISMAYSVPKQGSLAALSKAVAVIIWDEAPMENKGSIHALDQMLRDFCNPEVMFGGKIVILGGDF